VKIAAWPEVSRISPPGVASIAAPSSTAMRDGPDSGISNR